MTDKEPPVIEVVAGNLGKRHVECCRCRRKTWHSVLARARELFQSDKIRELDDREIIQCDGCRDVSFRHESQLGDPDAEPEYVDVVLYPPRPDRKARKQLSGRLALPPPVRSKKRYAR